MAEKFTDAVAFVDHIEQLFSASPDTRGNTEVLSNAAHMLQTAAAAQAAGANGTLVAAALLHDIGHWLSGDFDEASESTTDRRHESIGAHYIAQFYGPQVSRPVAYHVAAKRYLCAREPEYFGRLSPASVRSLKLQGGPMSQQEASAFEAIPEYLDAVALRRWDEYGKIADLAVPEFAHYRNLLLSLAVSTEAQTDSL